NLPQPQYCRWRPWRGRQTRGPLRHKQLLLRGKDWFWRSTKTFGSTPRRPPGWLLSSGGYLRNRGQASWATPDLAEYSRIWRTGKVPTFGPFTAPVDSNFRVSRSHLPIITSDALIMAQASSPFWSPRSATASFVMDAVIVTPCPISMRTC